MKHRKKCLPECRRKWPVKIIIIIKTVKHHKRPIIKALQFFGHMLAAWQSFFILWKRQHYHFARKNILVFHKRKIVRF